MRVRRPNAHKLSPEVWSRVCLSLDATPRRVFMLICAVKGLNAWLTDVWWEKFWHRHQAHLDRKGFYPHWYLRTDVLGMLCPQMHKPILKLVYGLFCSCCGRRYHHHLSHQMKMRICAECRQEQYISNAVLYVEYGIEFTQIIHRWETFVRYLPMHNYKPCEVATLSRNPIDVVPTCTRKMVFFWLPDIKCLYDLPALRREQAERVQKINLLKAAFKRKFAQIAPARHRLEVLHANELTRIRKPLAFDSWCAGGPERIFWLRNRKTQNFVYRGTVEMRQLEARLMIHQPVPITGANEFVLKTALSTFKLDADGLERNRHQWEIENPQRYHYKTKIYAISP